MVATGVREATVNDGPDLIELERVSPQGTSLVMHSERNDYFYRGRLFGNHRTLVVVDSGRVFGVLAATLKRVRIDGEPRLGALFYDLRLHPDYRKSVAGRHLLKAWLEMERWAEQRGADLIYGMVKSDNVAMHMMQRHKQGYRFAGEMRIVSRAVYRKRRGVPEPEEIDLEAHNREMGALVHAAYGERALYPLDLAEVYLTPEMAATGLFSCYRLQSGNSWASIGLYRVSREIWTRVVKLPWYYTLARPVFETIRPIVPLPQIPRRDGDVRYYHVFNHLVHGPRGRDLWNQLLSYANNVALEEGATLLTGMFDPSDPLCGAFSRGAMNVIDYHTGYRPLGDARSYDLRPFAPDVRDMD